MGDSALTDMLGTDTVRRVRDVLGHRLDAIVTLGDTAGRILWVSAPGTEGLFGRQPELLEGRTPFEYVHPDDVARARRAFARVLEGETVRYELRARTVDGSWRNVTSISWRVTGSWGEGVVTITTSDDPDSLAWPATAQP